MLAGRPHGSAARGCAELVVEGADRGRVMPTRGGPALRHPAQQKQRASTRNKEVFQDHTGLTATFGFQWSHVNPPGHI